MVEDKCTFHVLYTFSDGMQMARHFCIMARQWRAIFALWHANGNFLHGTLLYCIDPPPI